MTRASDAAHERHRRYKELRDAGMRPADAANEIGVAETSAWTYERWYLEQGGKPYRSQFSSPLAEPYGRPSTHRGGD